MSSQVPHCTPSKTDHSKCAVEVTDSPIMTTLTPVESSQILQSNKMSNDVKVTTMTFGAVDPSTPPIRRTGRQRLSDSPSREQTKRRPAEVPPSLKGFLHRSFSLKNRSDSRERHDARVADRARSCGRYGLRRGALSDPELMALPETAKERIHQDTERRRMTFKSKVYQAMRSITRQDSEEEEHLSWRLTLILDGS